MVSIVTINFHDEAITLELLKSLLRHPYDGDLEVIVVDNGCEKNSEALFQAIYPNIVYIPSKKNLGFAGGNNLGIRKASGNYIILLNNDTEVTEDLISNMVGEMDKNPEIGLLSPLLLYHENKKLIQYAGYSQMNYKTGRNQTIGLLEEDRGQYSTSSYETGFCHGAAVMFRRSDLDAVGLMDENYFLYYEEMDWCEKFRRKGKKIWFTGKAKLYHKESISVGKGSTLKTYFLTRNRMLFIRKNTSLYNQLIFGVYYFFFACPYLMVRCLISGRRDHIIWIWRAMKWNLNNSKESSQLGYIVTP